MDESNSINDFQRMQNLHQWIDIRFRSYAKDSKATAVVEAEISNNAQEPRKWFKKLLRQRLEKNTDDALIDSNAMSPRYIRERIGDSFSPSKCKIPLTTDLSNIIVELFANEGLTQIYLDTPRIKRATFVVLATVTLRKPSTIEEFIKVVARESSIVEMACPVFGNHDCVFTLYASVSEAQDWLWRKLRGYEDAITVSTMTYNTYGNVYHQFEAKRHPDYLSVQERRQSQLRGDSL